MIIHKIPMLVTSNETTRSITRLSIVLFGTYVELDHIHYYLAKPLYKTTTHTYTGVIFHMPYIPVLNATNASFVLKYGNYTDFNLWVICFAIIIILMVASRLLPSRDDVGKLLVAVLSVIFALAAVYGSLSIAHLDYTQGASIINESVMNESVTYNYIYPVQQAVSTGWLTGICIVLLIFSILNAVDIFIVMMERPNVDNMKKKGGRGIRI